MSRYGIEIRVRENDGYAWKRARTSDGRLYEYDTWHRAYRAARYWNTTIRNGLDDGIRVIDLDTGRTWPETKPETIVSQTEKES